jgi:hypothetical protein
MVSTSKDQPYTLLENFNVLLFLLDSNGGKPKEPGGDVKQDYRKEPNFKSPTHQITCKNFQLKFRAAGICNEFQAQSREIM